MAAQVQKLSYDEFKVEMRSSLRDRGVVDSLKSQVRASLVQELQAKSLGGARPQGKPELGLAQKAVNALIADFLRASTMPYTLSVFGPESGGGLSAANSAAPTARPDIMIGLGLTNVDAPCPAGMSLLEALLAHMRATLNKATAVCEVQTDPPRSADDAVDVEARLRDLDERFLRQSEAERGNPARGVEERMAQYQRECDERARTEIAAEVERLRETEISHARSEERAHFAAELSTRLDELEKDDPVLLLCYAYHMYMAIFAGGFQIRKMVTKAMGLTRGEEAGVKIFCFDDLGPSTTGFRNDYSTSLCHSLPRCAEVDSDALTARTCFAVRRTRHQHRGLAE